MIPRKFASYCLLIVSLLAWGALPVLPFLPLDTARKAAWAGGLFVFAEITWWLAVVLLGKEIVEWFRQQWRKLKGIFVKESPEAAPAVDSEGE